MGIGAYVLVYHQSDQHGRPRCVVTGESGRTWAMEPQQAANAATIEAVASARGLPERAVTIAVATAMQESELRNIEFGDRDSLGLFQQRPSQGWGTEDEVLDPVYAAGAFYDALVEVPDYESLPLAEAAQEVQRSAFPDAYARHEEDATLLAAALTGRAPGALNCEADTAPELGAPPSVSWGRVVGSRDAVHELMVREFGAGVAPTGAGGSLTVPVPADEQAVRGWELAHWSVAHSVELGIERITFGNVVWEADRSREGWRETGTEGVEGTENAADSGAELRLSVVAE
ncbi:heavy metal transporter [Streptomyces mayteni]